jgi:hypothetical protein
LRYDCAVNDTRDHRRGRKPISKTGEIMRNRPVRMTDAEWEKCKRLGGAAWVRARIRLAKITPLD